MKKFIVRFLNVTSFIFFIYVISLIDKTNLSLYRDSIIKNYGFFISAIFFLVISNLLIGLTWSTYIYETFMLKKTKSLRHWITSYKAKYVPGKISAPILRISDEIYSGKKKDLYFSILLENLYLILGNIFLGSYIFVKNYYNFYIHLLLYFFLNFLIYLSSKQKLLNFNFCYFKKIYIIQFTNLLFLLGIYLALLSIETVNPFEYSLLYQLIVGGSMLFSVIPAGIGLREFGVLEMSNIVGLKIYSLEFIVIFLRIFLIFVDFIIIFTASLDGLRKVE